MSKATLLQGDCKVTQTRTSKEQRKHSRKEEDTIRNYISKQEIALQFQSLKVSSEK